MSSTGGSNWVRPPTHMRSTSTATTSTTNIASADLLSNCAFELSPRDIRGVALRCLRQLMNAVAFQTQQEEEERRRCQQQQRQLEQEKEDELRRCDSEQQHIMAPLDANHIATHSELESSVATTTTSAAASPKRKPQKAAAPPNPRLEAARRRKEEAAAAAAAKKVAASAAAAAVSRTNSTMANSPFAVLTVPNLSEEDTLFTGLLQILHELYFSGEVPLVMTSRKLEPEPEVTQWCNVFKAMMSHELVPPLAPLSVEAAAGMRLPVSSLASPTSMMEHQQQQQRMVPVSGGIVIDPTTPIRSKSVSAHSLSMGGPVTVPNTFSLVSAGDGHVVPEATGLSGTPAPAGLPPISPSTATAGHALGPLGVNSTVVVMPRTKHVAEEAASLVSLLRLAQQWTIVASDWLRQQQPQPRVQQQPHLESASNAPFSCCTSNTEVPGLHTLTTDCIEDILTAWSFLTTNVAASSFHSKEEAVEAATEQAAGPWRKAIMANVKKSQSFQGRSSGTGAATTGAAATSTTFQEYRSMSIYPAMLAEVAAAEAGLRRFVSQQQHQRDRQRANSKTAPGYACSGGSISAAATEGGSSLLTSLPSVEQLPLHYYYTVRAELPVTVIGIARRDMAAFNSALAATTASTTTNNAATTSAPPSFSSSSQQRGGNAQPPPYQEQQQREEDDLRYGRIQRLAQAVGRYAETGVMCASELRGLLNDALMQLLSSSPSSCEEEDTSTSYIDNHNNSGGGGGSSNAFNIDVEILKDDSVSATQSNSRTDSASALKCLCKAGDGGEEDAGAAHTITFLNSTGSSSAHGRCCSNSIVLQDLNTPGTAAASTAGNAKTYVAELSLSKVVSPTSRRHSSSRSSSSAVAAAAAASGDEEANSDRSSAKKRRSLVSTPAVSFSKPAAAAAAATYNSIVPVGVSVELLVDKRATWSLIADMKTNRKTISPATADKTGDYAEDKIEIDEDSAVCVLSLSVIVRTTTELPIEDTSDASVSAKHHHCNGAASSSSSVSPSATAATSSAALMNFAFDALTSVFPRPFVLAPQVQRVCLRQHGGGGCGNNSSVVGGLSHVMTHEQQGEEDAVSASATAAARSGGEMNIEDEATTFVSTPITSVGRGEDRWIDVLTLRPGYRLPVPEGTADSIAAWRAATAPQHHHQQQRDVIDLNTPESTNMTRGGGGAATAIAASGSGGEDAKRLRSSIETQSSETVSAPNTTTAAASPDSVVHERNLEWSVAEITAPLTEAVVAVSQAVTERRALLDAIEKIDRGDGFASTLGDRRVGNSSKSQSKPLYLAQHGVASASFRTELLSLFRCLYETAMSSDGATTAAAEGNFVAEGEDENDDDETNSASGSTSQCSVSCAQVCARAPLPRNPRGCGLFLKNTVAKPLARLETYLLTEAAEILPEVAVPTVAGASSLSTGAAGSSSLPPAPSGAVPPAALKRRGFPSPSPSQLFHSRTATSVSVFSYSSSTGSGMHLPAGGGGCARNAQDALLPALRVLTQLRHSSSSSSHKQKKLLPQVVSNGGIQHTHSHSYSSVSSSNNKGDTTTGGGAGGQMFGYIVRLPSVEADTRVRASLAATAEAMSALAIRLAVHNAQLHWLKTEVWDHQCMAYAGGRQGILHEEAEVRESLVATHEAWLRTAAAGTTTTSAHATSGLHEGQGGTPNGGTGAVLTEGMPEGETSKQRASAEMNGVSTITTDNANNSSSSSSADALLSHGAATPSITPLPATEVSNTKEGSSELAPQQTAEEVSSSSSTKRQRHQRKRKGESTNASMSSIPASLSTARAKRSGGGDDSTASVQSSSSKRSAVNRGSVAVLRVDKDVLRLLGAVLAVGAAILVILWML